MTLRLALRSLAESPVRTAVLACGFGFGIAVMAALLGVGEVILEQAVSPALRGGGDVVVSGASGAVTSARFVMTSVLGTAPLSERVAAVSPSLRGRLYLVQEHEVLPILARAGVPSRERTIGDAETSQVAAWVDAPADLAWSTPQAADVLRAMDRFHPIPDGAADAQSWAEWLYFNGSAGGARFYLTFLFGPRTPAGNRIAVVRLQLDREGTITSYTDRAEVPEQELLASAPDVAVGASRVRLVGLRYHVTLALGAESGGPGIDGELTLDASARGGAMPPFTLHGARGWVSGYTVPVLSGPLGGWLRIGAERVSFDGGTGYHDHNWGFWRGVAWQWGQVAGDGVSFVYGRVRPPSDVADPSRIPGVLAVLGAEGPLGFATDVSIEEEDDTRLGRPRRVTVRARGPALDVTLQLSVADAIRNRTRFGGTGEDFLQLRGRYRVTGRIQGRTIDFSAPGAAETFRHP